MRLPAFCAACGAPDPRPWRRVLPSEPAVEETFLLVRCAGCGSAMTVGDGPPGEDLHAAGAYRPGTPRLHRPARPLLDLFDRQRLAILAGVRPPPARLLDVGAGKGRFVAAARARGYEATGIEPSPRHDAPHVVRASIDDAPVAAGSVDAITLWHVAEHLDDPLRALTALHAWLEPRGALLLGVPNLDSVQAKVGGPRWYHLDVPRHRVHFTARGAHALLRRAGFDVVATHHVLAEHNPFGMWQSAVSRTTPTPSFAYNALKRNARATRARDLVPTVAALPLVPVAALAEYAAGRAGRGGTVAISARRREPGQAAG